MSYVYQSREIISPITQSIQSIEHNQAQFMATRRVLRYTGTAISCAALFSLSAYLLPTCRSLKRTADLTVETKHDAPESFRDIHLVRGLVNPRNYTETHDSRSVTLKLPTSPHQSDELLLSCLVKGFFGGWVFTPEGKALSLARPADCKYTSECCRTPSPQ